jgi:hypothetical protein
MALRVFALVIVPLLLASASNAQSAPVGSTTSSPSWIGR